MKFIIRWDTGFGSSYEVIDTHNLAEAEAIAYDAWRDEAENDGFRLIEIFSPGYLPQ